MIAGIIGTLIASAIVLLVFVVIFTEADRQRREELAARMAEHRRGLSHVRLVRPIDVEEGDQ